MFEHVFSFFFFHRLSIILLGVEKREWGYKDKKRRRKKEGPTLLCECDAVYKKMCSMFN